MDSGNMSEMQDEVTQPDDVVVTDSEATEATPQAEDTEETEFYIEDEGDQQEQPKDDSGMSEAQLKAAFKEEREKRKRKNAELDAARKEAEELRQRVERAEKLAIEAAMGKEPNPSEYIDAVEYHEALKAYNEKAKQLTPQQKQEEQAKQASSIQLSDEQEFHAYKGREELRKHLKDFDQAEENVDKWIESNGWNKDAIKSHVIGLTHLHGIDYAKAIYAIDRIPELKQELAVAPNDMAIASVLKKAAGKIKTRKATKIDTKPEPTLSSTGSIDAAQKALEKARANYAENPTTENFRKVSAAKKQIKEKGE